MTCKPASDALAESLRPRRIAFPPAATGRRRQSEDGRGRSVLEAPGRIRETSLWSRFGLRPCAGMDAAGLRVLRSRALCDASAEEADALYDMGIRTVFDLRKPKELRERPDSPAVLERFEVIACTIDLQDDERRMQPSRAANIKAAYGAPGQRMLALYRGMAGHAGTIRSIIERIERTGGGVLVHCANGKDRCGVVCASLQLRHGIDGGVVMADYLATNRANARMNRHDLERLARTHAADEIAVLAAMFEAREEYLLAFFSAIEARYGSVRRWLS